LTIAHVFVIDLDAIIGKSVRVITAGCTIRILFLEGSFSVIGYIVLEHIFIGFVQLLMLFPIQLMTIFFIGLSNPNGSVINFYGWHILPI